MMILTKQASFQKPRRLLPVACLIAGLVLALPVLSLLTQGHSNTVSAKHSFVSSERPIDRVLNGTAIGSRPLTPARVPVPAIAKPARVTGQGLPRFIVPSTLYTPSYDVASLAPPVIDTRLTAPLVSAAAGPLAPEPRRKPQRQAKTQAAPLSQTATITERSLPPLELDVPAGSQAIALPRTIAEIEAPEPTAPIASATGAPKIALVLTAVGLNEAITRRAIDGLPAGITLAFAPIGKNADTLAKAAIADGHTIFAEIPMEPINSKRDPGEPLTLRPRNSASENIARMTKALDRIPGAVGISSYLGARFTRSDEAVAPVLQALRGRNLFLFENQPNSFSRLGPIARDSNISYAAGLIAIDGNRDAKIIQSRLTALENQAKRDGSAIAVATALRGTVSMLEKWVKEAQSRGIKFVPVTAL